MLSEAPSSPNWIAWSGQTEVLAAGSGHHDRERTQASAPWSNAMRYLCESRTQRTERRESALLESACAYPGLGSRQYALA